MKLTHLFKQIITESYIDSALSAKYFVKFGSHRSREKAARMLGKLPRPIFSYHYPGHYYPFDSVDDIEKIKNITGIFVKTKLPGKPDDWVPTFER